MIRTFFSIVALEPFICRSFHCLIRIAVIDCWWFDNCCRHSCNLWTHRSKLEALVCKWVIYFSIVDCVGVSIMCVCVCAIDAFSIHPLALQNHCLHACAHAKCKTRDNHQSISNVRFCVQLFTCIVVQRASAWRSSAIKYNMNYRLFNSKLYQIERWIASKMSYYH